MPQVEGQEGPAPKGDGSGLGLGRGAGGREAVGLSVVCVHSFCGCLRQGPWTSAGVLDSGGWGPGWTLFKRQGGVWDVGRRAPAE